MGRAQTLRRIGPFVAFLMLVLVACAPPSPAPSRSTDSAAASNQQSNPGRRKVLNLGLRTILDGFAISASPTLAGGGLGYIEIHSQALFTADKTTGRPIPRLLAEQPTLDNNGLR